MPRPILIVDDNEMNLDILKEILEDHYELVLASNGRAAVEACRERRPGVVLMDIMMPEMNGYDACRQIKQDTADDFVQVILVSAKASSEERVKGYAAGADDYIVKPFDDEELLAKLRVHVRLRDALEELAEARAESEGDNKRLHRVVENQARELIEKRDMIVFALANLADSRDPETGEHLLRIREYCRIIAARLGEHGPYAGQIDESFIDAIYLASPLHDIGKVGIPDAILLKPGRLTDSEFEIMKQHSSIGASALEQVARHGESGMFLQMAIDIARSHHERFDGSGYPDHKRGQEIPLSARITALADVFDALTSVRVYKAAFTIEVARLMIEQEKGKHFDPVVVDAFSACFEQFIAVRDRIHRETSHDLDREAESQAA